MIKPGKSNLLSPPPVSELVAFNYIMKTEMPKLFLPLLRIIPKIAGVRALTVLHKTRSHFSMTIIAVMIKFGIYFEWYIKSYICITYDGFDLKNEYMNV